MKPVVGLVAGSLIVCALAALWLGVSPFASAAATGAPDHPDRERQVFRHDRMGGPQLFRRPVQLRLALRALKPVDALAAGLKIDRDALSPAILAALEAGEADLNDPTVTVDFIRRHAVVGIEGRFTPEGQLRQIAITCALCHSTVDDSVVPGVGRRLDGWANFDLDVEAILSPAPNTGKLDAPSSHDGTAFHSDASVPYWNAFVANLEAGETGTFVGLIDPVRFPLTARFGPAAAPPEATSSAQAGPGGRHPERWFLPRSRSCARVVNALPFEGSED
jgi:hypothetical protein